MAIPGVIALSAFAGYFVLSPTHLGAMISGVGSAVLTIVSGIGVVAAAAVLVPPLVRWAAERVEAGRAGRDPQLGLHDFFGAHLALNVAPVVHWVADRGERWRLLTPLRHLRDLGSMLDRQLTSNVVNGLKAIAAAQAQPTLSRQSSATGTRR